ncbi:AbfB domain-containing protein [Streptomyces sp. SAS_270]|uniref:AbfB domain-containing protein n=1 Tax=Streptomyces sp. SAS_270 TaxID=3412748 RepID=UPI00403C4A25
MNDSPNRTPRARMPYGITAFAQDVPFHRTAGTADASWSSSRSRNHPDRYVRRADYVLRLDVISTATEKSDAVFRVGH